MNFVRNIADRCVVFGFFAFIVVVIVIVLVVLLIMVGEFIAGLKKHWNWKFLAIVSVIFFVIFFTLVKPPGSALNVFHYGLLLANSLNLPDKVVGSLVCVVYIICVVCVVIALAFPKWIPKIFVETETVKSKLILLEDISKTETPNFKLNQWGVFVSKIGIPFLTAISTIAIVLAVRWEFHSQKVYLGEQAKNADKTFEIAQKQLAVEQFNKAIEHLGSENQVKVLGGVHALHNLAMTYPNEYSQPISEILCGFIREETVKPEYQKQFLSMPDSSLTSDKPEPLLSPTSQIVIQAIIDILFCGENSNKYLRNTKSQGINLSGANLQGVVLSNARLQGVNLSGANLQGAVLSNANLQGADLTNANLRGAILHIATLEETLDGTAKIAKIAKISNADFRGVQSLENSRLTFEEAVKNHTDLKTDLSGIRIIDKQGNLLDLPKEKEAERRGKFSEAKVSDLSDPEVQQLAKELGLVKDKTEPRQMESESTESQGSDDP